ncbi:aminoacyl-tRNA hydrolase [Acidiluteibacter ferrifornacis]|uniref:Peptidyl-tRNA hydrolase n=1 Tax=Acidiluteibacter ferrifornacis TaxID=2692424 RepID=A0A6N9NE15_9FLAO|nr:aminoacyl-tRNA hydrolase [Acidiluteibacter ferrifornacis]MBR9830834.1 aminoacyl-tRNA hydrolase [bacterium]NBG64858.1 aminoacyl-tRNA hydrolase [Acidiluteibacter ferrifornacis]
MKYLIVGLGNIGAEYENTRHNIGFKALDALASAFNASFVTNRLGDVAEVKHKGRTLILLKPSTFMNLSGKAVNYWMQQEKIPLDKVLIITDDIALDFGVLRLKPKGSDGGHNGLKSIFQTLGTQDYCRIRFGVGSDFGRGQQVQYVLGEWTKEQQLDLPERLEQTVKMILAFTTTAVQRVMSDFNGK